MEPKNNDFKDLTVQQLYEWLKGELGAGAVFRVRVFETGVYFGFQTLVVERVPDDGNSALELVAAVSLAPAAVVKDVRFARVMGYTGDVCRNPDCGGMRVRRIGTCLFCDDCKESTGCS